MARRATRPKANSRARSKARPRSKRPRRTVGRRILRACTLIVVLVVFAPGLPIAVLRFVPPPTSAFMLHSHAADPATGRACPRVEYRWVAWADISPSVPRAVLVAEDQRFFEHRGFDTKAIEAALDDFAAGGRMRGASTLTQQVAKNLFLWPGRSVVRKALEAWLTVWIEALWPKRRIVEVHVNVAQFGPCVFGVEAASQRFFGVPAARVSPSQAAHLAAVLPSPGRMRVDDPGPFTEERARDILEEMNRGGGPAYLEGLSLSGH
jgi:monofunctional biosynthetic peptidoglycan transglycosylase